VSFYIWLFLANSLLIALLIFLFLYFCHPNVLTKAISTILVLLAGVGGIKVTPEYKGNVKFNFGSLSVDSQFIVGARHHNLARCTLLRIHSDALLLCVLKK
jgi:hypothetical protein